MIYIVGILFILIVSAAVLHYIPFKKPIMRTVCFGFILGILACCLISEPYRIARIMSDITALLG